MADFKPDREQESKEFNETFKPSKPKLNRKPRDIYNVWPIWLKNLAKIVAGLIILLIIVLIGRSIHHHATQNKITRPNFSDTTKKTSTSSASKSATGSSSSSKTSNGSASQKKSSSQSTTLPNSGPGDVAAVFAVAAVAGATSHYIFVRRRA